MGHAGSATGCEGFAADAVGINLRNLKLLMANRHGLHLIPVAMKKNIQALEKAGFVKSFTAIIVSFTPRWSLKSAAAMLCDR